MLEKKRVIGLGLAVLIVAMLVVPLAAGAASANGIVAPAEGAVIKGSVDITGVAAAPDLMKWQVDLLPGGNASQAIFLALDGNAIPVLDSIITLDTTQYPDGPYTIRLRVVHADSNYEEFLRNVTIANAGAKPAATVVNNDAPASTPAPTVAATPAAPATGNGFVGIKNGAIFKGKVDVNGVANDPHLMKWQIDLLPNGNANQEIFVALDGNAIPVLDSIITLDTTLYPDGPYTIRLRVVREDGNYEEYFANIVIANAGAKPAATVVSNDAPASTPAPIVAATPAAPATGNGFVGIKNGAIFKGKVDVNGVANDPHLMKWQIDLLPNGNANQEIFVALDGNAIPVLDSIITLDTTLYPDGPYTIRLRVVREDGNYEEYFANIVIANGNK